MSYFTCSKSLGSKNSLFWNKGWRTSCGRGLSVPCCCNAFSLSVMNAGDQACPETRPCPHPSPGDRKPARTLAGKADGTDVLLGNVEFQHRHAAQLNTHANSYAERWVRSVKEECLSRLILFGESSLRRALQQYLEHYHGERNHQGKDNRILFPSRPEV